MAPTHANCSPGEGPQSHEGADASTGPIPLTRTRRTSRRRTLRRALCRRRPSRPSTVWPCAQDNLREGSGSLASWLLAAVIKIVTTYTQPGQRVLLLESAPYLTPTVSRSATGGRSQRWSGPYAGLHEAGWTVVRLGRGVQTHIVVAQPDLAGDHAGDVPCESGSGPGLAVDDPATDRPVSPSAHHRPGPELTSPGVGPDRYNLVITAAEPHTLDWFHPADWAGLLTPTGTLAVITYGDRARGQCAEPVSSLVRAAHHAELRYLDRIALLRVPVHDSALANPASTRQPHARGAADSLATTSRHTRVHDDLLVFTRRPAGSDVRRRGDLG